MYSSSSGGAKEVECKSCGLRFCWACKQESHFPASCEVARQWNAKNSDEAENLQWILAKTKKCPNAEKMLVVVAMNFAGSAKEIGRITAATLVDITSAISTTSKKQKESRVMKIKNQKMLLMSWNDMNSIGRDLILMSSLPTMPKKRFISFLQFYHISLVTQKKIGLTRTHDRMHELSNKFQWRLNEANFLLEAVQEAIQCWHVLAWTYPIAFFMDQKINSQLFKQQQGTLENFCNGLQAKLDFDLDKLGDNKTRQEVIHYTRTSAQYRKNLFEYIENEISF
ncbi:hypothetical protein RFI_17380 [Reticulomyxa filosa]|uniref:IBR domain-containing protein n=1 Tax=Reticulomyxa filosa TaxID=46433 RepID=X6N1S6_RETFI|nr:hypothetical protein RFI_17380 [Reticulomyxa filosa]|eukprot:ETO19848.1 hypothetical protein RFI_17380 [Reticulomyxa filosa]